jgi:predicted transcriptional regulator
MRQRHALYLSASLTQHLQATADAHRVSKSAILEQALQQFLGAHHEQISNGLQPLQQAAMTRSVHRLERDLAISTELTATFVRYFLMVTPPIPEREHAAARALGQLRFEQVIEEVARRLRTDRSLMARVMSKLADDQSRTPSGSLRDNPRSDDTNAAAPSKPIPQHPKPTDGNG